MYPNYFVAADLISPNTLRAIHVWRITIIPKDIHPPGISVACILKWKDDTIPDNSFKGQQLNCIKYSYLL